MKKNLKILAVVLVMAVAACSFTTKDSEDPGKDKLLLDLITYVVSQMHYDAKDINNEFSANVYDNYIETLDASKRYFYKEDIEEFQKYREEIDDEIKGRSITFFDITHERLQKRVKEVQPIYQEILSKPFDFTTEEDINTDFDKLEFVSSKEEMKERWQKQLKFNTLITYYEMKRDEKAKKDNDASYEIKSDEELEAEARKSTRENLERYFDFLEDIDREDYFSYYINAIVAEFDPHTNYFAPQDKDRFDIRMSGKVEGIGARLMKDKDDITITEVVSGGPAWRSDEFGEGDVILKVQQEDEDEAVNISGMKLDDAVDLIKGPKGSKVTLTVRKKLMGNIEEITLVRDVVELEETFAKTSMVEKDGKKFGVINLPSFYFDMENANSRNAASDIKESLISLKKQGMEGLVLDLRNNGGGSLPIVVDIAGMFIEKGPVVQVKSTGQEKEVYSDKDPSIVWDGPMVIMVNEISASASEILAAAMQDYKRAVILGSKQTYGKGTVQNLMPLNRWLRNNDMGDLGAIKITTQKFYRINGGSVKLEGVKSDVPVPDRYSYVDIGEKDQENPLPWDKIDAAKFKPWNGYVDYDEVIQASKERMSNNEQLKLIDENARWIKTQSDENDFSLNYEIYASEEEKKEEALRKFDSLRSYNTNLTYYSLPEEEKMLQNDTILKEKRDRWHRSLSQDVYLEEAINVLSDINMNNITGKLADSNGKERVKN